MNLPLNSLINLLNSFSCGQTHQFLGVSSGTFLPVLSSGWIALQACCTTGLQECFSCSPIGVSAISLTCQVALHPPTHTCIPQCCLLLVYSPFRYSFHSSWESIQNVQPGARLCPTACKLNS